MRQRLPYYCIGALMVVAGHLEAQVQRWPNVATAFVVVLLLGIVGVAVVEFLVFERERILAGLERAEEHGSGLAVAPEAPVEVTVEIPACRVEEPPTVVFERVRPVAVVGAPTFTEAGLEFANAEAELAAQAGEAMAAVDAIASGEVRELGVA